MSDIDRRRARRTRTGCACCRSCLRELERDGAAGAVAGNDEAHLRTERANLRGEVRGKILDRRQRLAFAVKARRAKSEERLLGSQVPREQRDSRTRRRCVRRRQRPALASPRGCSGTIARCCRAGGFGATAGTRRSRPFARVAASRSAGRERTGRRIASQLVPVGPDPNVAASQLREKVRRRSQGDFLAIASRGRRLRSSTPTTGRR